MWLVQRKLKIQILIEGKMRGQANDGEGEYLPRDK